jgi:diguanylate cyclase (GGDEF)-like protein
MLQISMAKDPAVSLLYALIAGASTLLAISHYVFGYYNVMFLTMITIGIYTPAAIFLFLNREQSYSKYANILILTSVATITQYQLSIAPELTIHLAFAFPIISYFILPMRWAFTLNTAFMLCTSIQIALYYETTETIRLILIYLALGISSLCYAYINTVKRKNLLNLAVTDYQSGAYNHRHMVEKLHQEIARSAVTNRTLSLLAITIEDYQQIQDIHGNNISERLLKDFHKGINDLLRAGDDVFHNGNGTFYILLPNCPIEGAIVLKERLIKNIHSVQWQDVGDLQLVTGFATLESNENADQFLQRASSHLVKQQQTALRLLAFDK